MSRKSDNLYHLYIDILSPWDAQHLLDNRQHSTETGERKALTDREIRRPIVPNAESHFMFIVFVLHQCRKKIEISSGIYVPLERQRLPNHGRNRSLKRSRPGRQKRM